MRITAGLFIVSLSTRGKELSDNKSSPIPPLPDWTEKAESIDRREYFEELSRASTCNPDSERAFLLNKIEMLRKDLDLSDAERDRKTAELQSRINSLTQDKN